MLVYIDVHWLCKIMSYVLMLEGNILCCNYFVYLRVWFKKKEVSEGAPGSPDVLN